MSYHPGVSRANALIEYSHRLTASLVFVFVTLLALTAWRRYRRVRRVVVPASLAVGLWLFQAVLGGLVVKFGLTPWLVTGHLVVANVFLGTLAYASVAAFSVEVVPAGTVDRATRLAWAGAGAVLAVIAVGAVVRSEGAGLAFADWPLMGGSVIPSMDGLRPVLMFVHRALALAVGLYVAVVAARAWKLRRSRRPFAALASAAAGLYAAQVLIGAANVWSRMAPAAVVAHVAVSSVAWATLVAAAAASRACWMVHEADRAVEGSTPRPTPLEQPQLTQKAGRR